jgi:alpha-1,3-rhamnosyl/mannosyltransferase
MNRRGYGRYTRELLSRLLTLDRQNEYWFFLDSETARHSEGMPDGARLMVVETSRAATQAASAEGHRSLRDIWAMRRAVQRHARDLDLFYFPSVYTFFPLGGRTKVAVTIHDTIAERHPDLIFPNWRSRMLWTLKVRWAVRRADLVLTVSQASRRDVARLFGLRPETVRVVSDAVSETFHPLADGPRAREVLATYGVPPDARTRTCTPWSMPTRGFSRRAATQA